MQCAVSTIKRQFFLTATSGLSFAGLHLSGEHSLGWLREDVEPTGERRLCEDRLALRALEAEVYALNDQFETEIRQVGGRRYEYQS